jgi:death-on-curing protein
MEIWLDEAWLTAFYEAIVEIYRGTADPITVGYNNSIIHVCIERPQTDVYNVVPFPHLLHKASVLMDTIINFHPFADGNKRVALLTTYYFLYWNGYNFTIPEDAADFTIEIA